MSNPNSPCAACKLLRRKCTQECVFAPYFPPDQPQKFANVHRVFGASNVTKLLNELHPSQREEAVASLAYEAEARLNDPVYGCVGTISYLQSRLKELQGHLTNAKKELATYIGPQAMISNLQAPAAGFIAQQQMGMLPQNMLPMMAIPTGPRGGQIMIRDPQQQNHQHHQQQQFVDPQQQLIVTATGMREPEGIFGTYDQPQHQQQLVRFNDGFDAVGSGNTNSFNQLNGGGSLSPSLTLGSFDNPLQIQAQQPDHHQLEAQLLLQTEDNAEPPASQHLQRAGSEEGNTVGP